MSRLESLSLFLPCYNERDNLGALAREALSVLPDLADAFEILIINDGSTDGTRELAVDLTNKLPGLRLVDIPHGGYGAALSAGFANARYAWVAFTDADGQFAVGDLRHLVAAAPAHDCVLGYRERRVEGGIRRLNQFLLKVWAYVLFGIPWSIRDINCAFKLLHRDLLTRCLPLQSTGGIVSTELMRAVVRARARIAQVPVRHFRRQHGRATGANPRVILRAVAESARLVVGRRLRS